VSLVAPVTIDVDGSIQLIDCDQPKKGTEQAADRIRQGRLNDVMIMIECERDTIETALAARLQSTNLPKGLDQLNLTIDERGPKFHVRLTARPDQEFNEVDTKQGKAAIETEIATELLNVIKRRAVTTNGVRWQPSVTATVRSTANTTKTGSKPHSIWFHTVLWLLAAVILGTGYLYMANA